MENEIASLCETCEWLATKTRQLEYREHRRKYHPGPEFKWAPYAQRGEVGPERIAEGISG